MFMPKVLNFLTFKNFMPTVCCFNMFFGISFDFLEKGVFIFVGSFPECWECNLI